MFPKPKFLKLSDTAEDEVYALIDKHVRPLPKKADGTIDKEAGGFQHNDVDALRHAYVSGVYTMEYGKPVAYLLGTLNEFNLSDYIGRSRPGEGNSRKMDLHNNKVGRKYGQESKTREELSQKLLKALKNDEMITDLNDDRE